MLRTLGDQVSLWESLLPEEVLRLPAELARVDALLDDPVFFAPFMPLLSLTAGRPSTPVECYLRLMFLKFRYRPGLRACALRSATRLPDGGSAGSRWTRRCRIRPR